MTADMVERLVELQQAEALPLRWAALQLVAVQLQLDVEYGSEHPLPDRADALRVYADEKARRAVYEDGWSPLSMAAADIWRRATRTEREAAVEALWAELEQPPAGGRINRNDLLASPDEGRIRMETQERLDEVRRQNDRGVHELFRGPDGPDPVWEALTRDAEPELQEE